MFRSAEQTLEQAVIQKLSRIISGLYATRVLLARGLYQEVGILFRVLEELFEDVVFLCQPLPDGNVTALHKKYLAYFYQEEFDMTQRIQWPQLKIARAFQEEKSMLPWPLTVR